MAIRYTEDLTSGKVYYGTEFNSSYIRENAFDDNPSTSWVSIGTGGNPKNDSITVDFGENKKIAKLTLIPWSVYACKAFKLQFSDDNITFTDHYIQTNLPFSSVLEKREYEFAPPVDGHRYWRVFVTATHKTEASSGFAELEMMEQLSQKYLIQQSTNIFSINSSFYPVGQTPTKELFEKFGTYGLTPLTQTFNKNNILMQDDGAVGVGKQFSCDLNSEMLSINEVNME